MSATARVAVAVGAVSVVSLLLPTPAHGAQSQTDELCSSTKVACSISVASVWASGSSREISVTGKADHEVRLRVFRLDQRADGGLEWEPVGKTFTVQTDKNGWGAVDRTLPSANSGVAGGNLLVAPADAPSDDLGSVLGVWSEEVTPTPELRGDGFAKVKPVGVPLTMELAHVAQGSRFTVEIDDAGGWRSASTVQTCASTQCSVEYEIPSGLSPTTHRVRLLNVDSGIPAATWNLTPSKAGTPQVRRPIDLFEPLAVDVPGSMAARAGSSTAAVSRPRSANLDTTDLIARQQQPAQLGESHPAWTVVGLSVGSCLLALAGVITLLRKRSA